MTLKQISLTMPQVLLKASKEYSAEYGYKNVQEFILELIRNKVMLERYRQIEMQMMKGKKKSFSKSEAIKYIKSL